MRCKNYIKIINGVVAEIEGEFKEGAYMICLDCKHIAQKDGCYQVIYDLTKPEPIIFQEENNE